MSLHFTFYILTFAFKSPMFKFSKRGPVEYLESVALSRCDFLTHAFCTRRGGVSEGQYASLNFSGKEGDTKEKVQQNWEIVAHAFDLNVKQFFFVHQVHGDRTLILDNCSMELPGDQARQYDAIITDRPGLAIGIKTADCVPVFLADMTRRIIGVVHAGWRGASLSIAGKVVKDMADRFSSKPENIIAAIGPAIGPCCYEVDEKVLNAESEDEKWKSSFTSCREKGRWMMDLWAANRHQLLSAGVSPENIYSADICTSCQKERFFSHRRDEGKTGRQINFMMLKVNRTE